MAKKNIIPSLIILVLPVIFALTLPVFFSLHWFTEPQQFVSIMAMIIFPFTAGLLLVLSSSLKAASRAAYKVFMPWVPILLFFFITFLFQLEDCACWIIGLPLYLLLSSVGGLTGGYIKSRKPAHHAITVAQGE
jgi:hypothetical protein